MAVAGAALPTALLHKGLQMIFSLAAVFYLSFQTRVPPPHGFFQRQSAILLAIFIIKESMLFYHIFCNRTSPVPNKIRRMNIAFRSGIRYNGLYSKRPPAQTRSLP